MGEGAGPASRRGRKGQWGLGQAEREMMDERDVSGEEEATGRRVGRQKKYI